MDIAKYVSQVSEVLLKFSDAQSDVPRAPGKWSAKELVGHLIDSAANNHQRLVRGQFSDELGIVDYDQDDWVRVQAYAQGSWRELITLWVAYNRHLAHVIAVMPEAIRFRTWERSSWWQVIPQDAPCTLDYLVHRYEVHLVHHVAQIYEALGVDTATVSAE